MIASILNSVKKFLGIEPDYDVFDEDLIIAINGCFFTLNQLNCGTKNFSITSDREIWSDFIQQRANLQGVKSYVCLKTKMMFDPPTSSFVCDAYNNQIKEFEWRLNHQGAMYNMSNTGDDDDCDCDCPDVATEEEVDNMLADVFTI